ncbi:aminoglycoside phosphotransferase family protein [Thalassobacillus hwangdonensis]|uniref:Aminoglycoside phosphotransferase family protein n=1 Tax=Thalassobacillus hwangdonensis TaxID=546108 RepID=A0ABW3L5I7_9BACI
MMLSTSFEKTIVHFFGEKGREWIEGFDSLYRYCEERWGLEIHEPFHLSVNYVAPAVKQDGTEVVLKLSVPSEEFLSELETLKAFNGEGVVPLLDYDIDRGIMLLARVKPGITLASAINDDEEGVRIAADAVRKLWRPVEEVPHIPNIDSREASFSAIVEKNADGLGPINCETLQEGYNIFSDLVKTQKKTSLLHGDFHHFNLLKSENGWTVIDPKGLIGEREYDLIQFLLNELPQEQVAEVLERRIDLFVEALDLDRERLLLWGYAHAVLATSWSVTDDGEYSKDFYRAISIFREMCKREQLLR